MSEYLEIKQAQIQSYKAEQVKLNAGLIEIVHEK
jgi:hypothetical protein